MNGRKIGILSFRRKERIDIDSQIIHNDCLLEMPKLPDGCVDCIITDLPFGTTACKWDTVIPFEPLWKQYKRVIKPNGAIVLFGSQPFTSALIMSNPKMFKYEWIWEKNKGSNFATVKYQPMKEHENICIFGNGKLTYNETRIERSESGKNMVRKPVTSKGHRKNDQSVTGNFDSGHNNVNLDVETRCARSIIKFNTEVGLHPTQKPTKLLEFLINTYTNESELILDSCAGSFTTAIACLNTNRRYICIEKDLTYFNIGKKRIQDWHDKRSGELF